MKRVVQTTVRNAGPPARTAIVAGVVIGVTLGAVTAPQWLPVLMDSMTGANPKAYWYLSRASGFVAYFLIWISVTLGLVVTSKTSRDWPGGYTAVDMHNFTGMLGLGFALFHVLVLLGDGFMDYTVAQLLVPFANSSYRPLWVGLGQLGLYLTLLVALSFFARRRIGQRTWRRLHYGSFAVYWMVTVHGVMSGTDTSSPAALVMYSVTGGATYFLFVFRVLVSLNRARPRGGRKQHERQAARHPAG